LGCQCANDVITFKSVAGEVSNNSGTTKISAVFKLAF